MGNRIPLGGAPGLPNASNDEIVTPTTAWDAMQAAWNIGRNYDAMGASLARREAIIEQQGMGEMLQPNDLNQRFRDVNLEKPFSEAMTLQAAQALVDDVQSKRDLEDRIARSSTAGRAGAFVAGMAGSMSDPVDFAANIASGKIVGVVAKNLGRLVSAERGAQILSKIPNAARGAAGFVGRTAARFAEGAAGTLPLIPVQAGLREDFLGDYTAADAMQNALAGGVLFAGGGALAEALGGIRGFMGRRGGDGGAQAHEIASEIAINQAAQGHPVEVDAALHQIVGEMNRAAEGLPDMAFPADTPSYRGVEWHAYTPADHLGLADAQGNAFDGESLGDGLTYFTDRPGTANGHAVDLEGQPGAIHSATLPEDVRLVNLEEKPAPEFVAAVRGALGDAKASWLDAAQNGNEVMAGLRREVALENTDPGVFTRLAGALKSAGFDGYERTGGEILGIRGEPHQTVALFDQAKVTPIRTETANPALLPAPDQVAQRAALERNQGELLGTTRDAIARASEVRKVPPPEVAKLESAVSDLRSEIQALDASGKLDPAVKTALETATQDLEAKWKTMDQAYKAAFSCLTGGGE